MYNYIYVPIYKIEMQYIAKHGLLQCFVEKQANVVIARDVKTNHPQWTRWAQK